jgi:hypothetical protein
MKVFHIKIFTLTICIYISYHVALLRVYFIEEISQHKRLQVNSHQNNMLSIRCLSVSFVMLTM